jgi:hypothetical protein
VGRTEETSSGCLRLSGWGMGRGRERPGGEGGEKWGSSGGGPVIGEGARVWSAAGLGAGGAGGTGLSRRDSSPRRTVSSCSRSRKLLAIWARSAVLRSRRSCRRRVWSRRLENSSRKPGKRQYRKPTPPAPSRREKTPVHSQMLPGRRRKKGADSAGAGRLAAGGRIDGQRRSSTGLQPPRPRRTAVETTDEPSHLRSLGGAQGGIKD